MLVRADQLSGSAMTVSSRSPTPSPVTGRLVRLGQVIPLCDDSDAEVHLLSYARVEAGPQLSLFVRSSRQAGPSGPEARSLEKFTATDDRGTSYRMMVRDLCGWVAALMMASTSCPGCRCSFRWAAIPGPITTAARNALQVDIGCKRRACLPLARPKP